MDTPSIRDTRTETWFVDCEFGYRDRRVDLETAFEPVVFCFVGNRTKERLAFWRRDDRLATFFANHADDLYVSHVNTAEMKYLLRRGIPLPKRWFDTLVGWRRLYNEPDHLEASLVHCLGRLGAPHLALLDKDAIRKRILYLDFNWNSPTDRAEIIDYCFGDCDGCGVLYRHLHDKINPKTMAYWCEYAKAVSAIELRGIPFDFKTTNLIWYSRLWICEDIIGQVNDVYPVFAGTSFRRRAFLEWCSINGIAWPWKRSETTGRMTQSLDKDVMEDMEVRHPFIRRVRQVLRTYESFYERRPLKVDKLSRRHYYSTWAFRSITGRNQPRDFVFSGPKWLRYLIVPESPNHALSYIDFKAEEVGIAASLSDDANMREMYRSRDAHLWFAIADGAVPLDATKKTHPEIRAKYKTVNLGVLYGQTAYGISHRLGVTIDEAGALLQGTPSTIPPILELVAAGRPGRVRPRRDPDETRLGLQSATTQQEAYMDELADPIRRRRRHAADGGLSRTTRRARPRAGARRFPLLLPTRPGRRFEDGSGRESALRRVAGPGRPGVEDRGGPGVGRGPVALGREGLHRPLPGRRRQGPVGFHCPGAAEDVPQCSYHVRRCWPSRASR